MNDGDVPEPILPCGHPGVTNIQHTVNAYDYECPTCGEQYARGEL
jgi:predicted RNA-binding Zn-ribbon protein involved in translation (DUF1610 family)